MKVFPHWLLIDFYLAASELYFIYIHNKYQNRNNKLIMFYALFPHQEIPRGGGIYKFMYITSANISEEKFLDTKGVMKSRESWKKNHKKNPQKQNTQNKTKQRRKKRKKSKIKKQKTTTKKPKNTKENRRSTKHYTEN